jgi:hypothetical protein
MKQIIGIILLSIFLLVFSTPTLAVIDKNVDKVVLSSVEFDTNKLVVVYKGNYIFPAPQEIIIFNNVYNVGINYKGDYIYPVPLVTEDCLIINKLYTLNISTFKDLPMVVPLVG